MAPSPMHLADDGTYRGLEEQRSAAPVKEAQVLVNAPPRKRYPGELAFCLLWASLIFGITLWIFVSMFVPLIMKRPFEYNVLLGTLGVIAAVLALYTFQLGIGAILWTRWYVRDKDEEWYQLWQQRRSESGIGDYESVQHFVVITAYREPMESLRSVATTLLVQRSDEHAARRFSMQITPVFAFEEREGESAKEKAAQLQAEFGDKFRNVLVFYHPEDLEGEIAGKASNFRYALGRIERHVMDGMAKDTNGCPIRPERVWVHVCDGDSLYDPNYFPAVTYSICTETESQYNVYQPCMLGTCNFWKVPVFSRQLALMVGAHEMLSALGLLEFHIPFSTYGLALSTLQHIGGEGGAAAAQDGDVIAEDHHLFVKGFFATGGRLRVRAIPLPCFNYLIPGCGCRGCGYRGGTDCDARFTQAVRHMFGVVELAYFVSLMVRGGWCFFRRYEFHGRLNRLLFCLFKLIKVHIVGFGGFWICMGIVLNFLLHSIALGCHRWRSTEEGRLPDVCDMDFTVVTALRGYIVFSVSTALGFIGSACIMVAFTSMLRATKDAMDSVADPGSALVRQALWDEHRPRRFLSRDSGGAWCGMATQLVVEYVATGFLTSVYYGAIPSSIALLRTIRHGHRMKYVSAASLADGGTQEDV